MIHSVDYVLYKKNTSKYLSIDETCLSQDEVYTLLTNKLAKGKKGSFVAMVRGIKSDTVINTLKRLPRSLRLKVKEITLDLSPSMKLIAKRCFPNAVLVSDRFHVQKLMNEAVNDLRVDYRWQAIDQENKEIQLAKECHRKFVPNTFHNGDTPRQLLARSRMIVIKHYSKWTENQRIRAQILFEQYPEIEQAYKISMELTQIYNQHTIKEVALLKLTK